MSHRPAVAGDCKRCRADVLHGIADRVAGLSAIVDPRPLARGGELLAVVDLRRTFEADADGCLHRRDRWAIRSAPRGSVLAEHRCGQPLPAAWLLPVPPTKPAPSTDCEF